MRGIDRSRSVHSNRSLDTSVGKGREQKLNVLTFSGHCCTYPEHSSWCLPVAALHAWCHSTLKWPRRPATSSRHVVCMHPRARSTLIPRHDLLNHCQQTHFSFYFLRGTKKSNRSSLFFAHLFIRGSVWHVVATVSALVICRGRRNGGSRL